MHVLVLELGPVPQALVAPVALVHLGLAAHRVLPVLVVLGPVDSEEALPASVLQVRVARGVQARAVAAAVAQRVPSVKVAPRARLASRSAPSARNSSSALPQALAVP